MGKDRSMSDKRLRENSKKAEKEKNKLENNLEKLKNVDKVYIIGGNNAISENVEAELKNIKNIKSIERLAGKDRVETSKAVAREIKEYSKVFVVNGYKGEADAMSASPLAAKYKAPIIPARGGTCARRS